MFAWERLSASAASLSPSRNCAVTLKDTGPSLGSVLDFFICGFILLGIRQIIPRYYVVLTLYPVDEGSSASIQARGMNTDENYKPYQFFTHEELAIAALPRISDWQNGETQALGGLLWKDDSKCGGVVSHDWPGPLWLALEHCAQSYEAERLFVRTQPKRHLQPLRIQGSATRLNYG